MNYKWQRDISSSVHSLHFSWEQDHRHGSFLCVYFQLVLCTRLISIWPGSGHEHVPLHIYLCNAVCCSAPDQAQLIQMVVWMLQRRLLIQLHTYVCLLVAPCEDEPGLRDEDPPLAARAGGRSLSTPSALSFGSPSMSSPSFPPLRQV